MTQPNSIVSFQKTQYVEGSGFVVSIMRAGAVGLSGDAASNYYALSSLVSNVTLQSRYIVPPDISLFIQGSPSQALDGGIWIGPSGENNYVYEFPDVSSWRNLTTKKTQIINWVGSGDANPNDPGIKWGHSGERTAYDDPTKPGLHKNLTFPKVRKSRFMSLEDTPEFIDISKRIGKIEQFLSNFSTTTTITPQSNFYLGLSGNLSDVRGTSGTWKDISNAGLWRQLV